MGKQGGNAAKTRKKRTKSAKKSKNQAFLTNSVVSASCL
jgi:hypothetical protein